MPFRQAIAKENTGGAVPERGSEPSEARTPLEIIFRARFMAVSGLRLRAPQADLER